MNPSLNSIIGNPSIDPNQRNSSTDAIQGYLPKPLGCNSPHQERNPILTNNALTAILEAFSELNLLCKDNLRQNPEIDKEYYKRFYRQAASLVSGLEVNKDLINAFLIENEPRLAKCDFCSLFVSALLARLPDKIIQINSDYNVWAEDFRSDQVIVNNSLINFESQSSDVTLFNYGSIGLCSGKNLSLLNYSDYGFDDTRFFINLGKPLKNIFPSDTFIYLELAKDGQAIFRSVEYLVYLGPKRLVPKSLVGMSSKAVFESPFRIECFIDRVVSDKMVIRTPTIRFAFTYSDVPALADYLKYLKQQFESGRNDPVKAVQVFRSLGGERDLVSRIESLIVKDGFDIEFHDPEKKRLYDSIVKQYYLTGGF